MAFQQVGGPSFQQLDDSTNPAAQAYARMALARNGIHVPPGHDAAAMWRQFSAQRALQQNQANFQAQGEAPDMGVTPGQIPPSTQPGVYHPPDQGAQFDPSALALGQRLPDGGYRQPTPLTINGIEGQNRNQDWRMKIAQMASSMQNDPSFHNLQGGPAELAMQRLIHVNQAVNAVRSMAHTLSHSKPSRAIPRGIMRTKAY